MLTILLLHISKSYLMLSITPPLFRCRPDEAIPGKGVRCLRGQTGVHALPDALPNIDAINWDRAQKGRYP